MGGLYNKGEGASVRKSRRSWAIIPLLESNTKDKDSVFVPSDNSEECLNQYEDGFTRVCVAKLTLNTFVCIRAA